MRLSELVARCAGLGDPIIAIEGPAGLPVDIRDVDQGVAVLPGDIPAAYVCLLTDADADD